MSKNPVFAKPVKKQTMAEQMAGTIQELILDSDLESGEALPTEPELAEQFGVSRAVVRDATRILMARGLVEVQHGRGVFRPADDHVHPAVFGIDVAGFVRNRPFRQFLII